MYGANKNMGKCMITKTEDFAKEVYNHFHNRMVPQSINQSADFEQIFTVKHSTSKSQNWTERKEDKGYNGQMKHIIYGLYIYFVLS